MNRYQFIAAIFQSVVSLAWPATVFGCVWLFREKLAELLPFLRVKHKDFEMSFLLDRAEKEAAKLTPPLDKADAEPTPEQKSRFREIAGISPRAAIQLMRGNLEEAVRTFGQAVGISNISPYMNYASLVRELRKHHLIDTNTGALLDDLRGIGNAAAHNQGNPTEQEALRFGELAEKLIRQLDIGTGAAQMPPPGPIPQGP
jgi:hypothetical protein